MDTNPILTFLLACPSLSFHQELPRASSKACFALTTLNKSEPFILSSQPELQTSHRCIILVKAVHSPDLRELLSQSQPPTTSICHCSSSEGNKGQRFCKQTQKSEEGKTLAIHAPNEQNPLLVPQLKPKFFSSASSKE